MITVICLCLWWCALTLFIFKVWKILYSPFSIFKMLFRIKATCLAEKKITIIVKLYYSFKFWAPKKLRIIFFWLYVHTLIKFSCTFHLMSSVYRSVFIIRSFSLFIILYLLFVLNQLLLVLLSKSVVFVYHFNFFLS